MACDLTRGRLIDCKDSIGGLKHIYMSTAYANNIEAVATISSGKMTSAGFANWSSASTSVVTVFKYDLIPNLSSMTVNIQSDNATGTAFFNQTLSVTLQKIDVATNNELKLMSYSRTQIFVQDQNDNVFLLGMNNGCYVTGGTIVTGAAMGDMNGYTIEWGAEEKDPIIQLPASAGVATAKYPFDGLTDESALTITPGT